MTLQTVTQWIFGRAGRSAVVEPSAVQEVSRDEVIRVIDEMARQRRGVSAAELLCAYRSGKLQQTGDVADLLVYSDLLSPEDPIFFEPVQRTTQNTRIACG